MEKQRYTLEEIMTPTEAAEKWGLANGATIRKSIERNKFRDNEIKRSGNVWLITPDAMMRVFGDPKKPKKSNKQLSVKQEPVKQIEFYQIQMSMLQQKAYELYMDVHKMSAYMNAVFLDAAQAMKEGKGIEIVGTEKNLNIPIGKFIDVSDFIEWMIEVKEYFQISDETIDKITNILNS